MGSQGRAFLPQASGHVGHDRNSTVQRLLCQGVGEGTGVATIQGNTNLPIQILMPATQIRQRREECFLGFEFRRFSHSVLDNWHAVSGSLRRVWSHILCGSASRCGIVQVSTALRFGDWLICLGSLESLQKGQEVRRPVLHVLSLFLRRVCQQRLHRGREGLAPSHMTKCQESSAHTVVEVRWKKRGTWFIQRGVDLRHHVTFFNITGSKRSLTGEIP
mmetsp:Transcript_753/g.2111  ORF Transcript_753/g.2111 Transcript_753/m.2111 type:complete len:218 (-) Transcript_753:1230-1883(-)